MILKFLDREEEIKKVEEKYESNESEFAVIYGRRRIGKTELIKKFVEEKKAFYFLCEKNKIEVESERFLKKFNRKFDVFIEARDMEEFFEQVCTRFKNERIIIAIDEFSYWVEREKDKISSQFQYIVDEILPGSKVFLIVCGSLISTMESLLSYKNPLYGRATLRLKVLPFSFSDACKFHEGFGIDDLVKVYASVGGVPAYLKEFYGSLSFEENVNRTFFNKDNRLFDDAERLLKDELREPYVYLSIMEQISEGATTLSEISSKSKVDVTNLPKYLRILENMGLIKKIYPVIRERTGKRGIYKIQDNYFRFYLKFVYRYKEEIELGIMEFGMIEKGFNRYVGTVFEDLAAEFVIKNIFDLPFQFFRIGKWWYKDREIDLIALNEDTKQIAFFEVKWHEFEKEKEVGRLLAALKEKSAAVNWFNNKRTDFFGIIAKKIDGEVKDRLRSEG
ncbi:MAG: ATP-binding protein, partial [Methanophagales archaeon]|nr:ATP-binding protein [Methanophagales archaeon]